MEKLNLNPKGIKTGDCVIRAIAYATQQSWDTVYKDLCEIGFKMKRMPEEKQVYEKYLDKLGWEKQKQPRTYFNDKYTVDEFCEKLANKDVYVITVANHMTVVANKEIVDTWDCGRKCVGNYWVKRS